jgi:hypothetical protein
MWGRPSASTTAATAPATASARSVTPEVLQAVVVEGFDERGPIEVAVAATTEIRRLGSAQGRGGTASTGTP